MRAARSYGVLPGREVALDPPVEHCRNVVMDRGEHIRWFAREVLPHEADVRKWLARRIRGLPNCDLDEIVQEAYARLWAVGAERILNARAYFFVTARHVLGEVLRRSRVVAIETLADMDSLNLVDENGGPERRVSGREELDRMRRVLATLPPKCREAFELRKFHELSQKEISQRMNVAESTVEKHLVKALRIIMNEMKEAGSAGPTQPATHHGIHHKGR